MASPGALESWLCDIRCSDQLLFCACTNEICTDTLAYHDIELFREYLDPREESPLDSYLEHIMPSALGCEQIIRQLKNRMPLKEVSKKLASMLKAGTPAKAMPDAEAAAADVKEPACKTPESLDSRPAGSSVNARVKNTLLPPRSASDAAAYASSEARKPIPGLVDYQPPPPRLFKAQNPPKTMEGVDEQGARWVMKASIRRSGKQQGKVRWKKVNPQKGPDAYSIHAKSLAVAKARLRHDLPRRPAIEVD